MFTVFIDGQEGTTGLRIHERLKNRNDLTILEIPFEKRKCAKTKSQFLNDASAVILCLPDAAAKESAAMVENPGTKIIDASTAFRTASDWVYGLPELHKGQRDRIRTAMRISNPGCHATGFILSLFPLVQAGIVPEDYPVTCHSITGYSGGGKKMIASYQDTQNDLNGPRHYALSLKHKHLPEMQKHTGLTSPPLFSPIVGNFYSGMVVTIPLITRFMKKRASVQAIHEIFSAHYASEPFIKIMPRNPELCLEDGFLSPVACNDTNRLDLFVFGHDEQVLIMARFDNLGKGASGAAVQNLNIAMGVDETAGLI